MQSALSAASGQAGRRQTRGRVEPSLGREAQPKAVFGDQGGDLPRRHRRHVHAEISGLRRGYRCLAVRRHRVSVHESDRRAGIEEHRLGHAQVSASQTSPVLCVRSVPGAIFTVPRNAPESFGAPPSIGTTLHRDNRGNGPIVLHQYHATRLAPRHIIDQRRQRALKAVTSIDTSSASACIGTPPVILDQFSRTI
jgi:hypothetical protein